MDNELMLILAKELLKSVNAEEVTTVNINQSKAVNGYKGYTIDIVFSEPNTNQAEEPEDEIFYAE